MLQSAKNNAWVTIEKKGSLIYIFNTNFIRVSPSYLSPTVFYQTERVQNELLIKEHCKRVRSLFQNKREFFRICASA